MICCENVPPLRRLRRGLLLRLRSEPESSISGSRERRLGGMGGGGGGRSPRDGNPVLLRPLRTLTSSSIACDMAVALTATSH